LGELFGKDLEGVCIQTQQFQNMRSPTGGIYAFLDIKGGATGQGALLELSGFTVPR
jgi:hypothetical protein